MRKFFIRSINTLKEELGNSWLFWNAVLIILVILSIFNIADRWLVAYISICTIWVDTRTLFSGRKDQGSLVDKEDNKNNERHICN